MSADAWLNVAITVPPASMNCPVLGRKTTGWSRPIAEIVGGSRNVSRIERHRIDAVGPEDRVNPGVRVVHGRLGYLGFVVVEIGLVIVSSRHGNKAGEVRGAPMPGIEIVLVVVVPLDPGTSTKNWPRAGADRQPAHRNRHPCSRRGPGYRLSDQTSRSDHWRWSRHPHH